MLVLFLGGTAGAWTPVELHEAGGVWTGTRRQPPTRFNISCRPSTSHGNVGVSTNKGYYFAGAPAETPAGPISISLIGAQAQNGTYTGAVTVNVTTPAGVTATLKVDGNTVTPGA